MPVTKKELKDLDLRTETEYFNLIVEKHIGGIFSDVHEMIKKFGKSQKKLFISWCLENIIETRPQSCTYLIECAVESF
jgi:hypothetical protein